MYVCMHVCVLECWHDGPFEGGGGKYARSSGQYEEEGVQREKEGEMKAAGCGMK